MFDKITFVTQPFSQDGSGTVLGIGNEGLKVTQSHHWETQSNANEIHRVWKSTEQSWAGKGFPEEVTPKLRPEGWVEVGEAQNGKKSVLEECSVQKDCSAKVSREEGAASVSWACMNAGFKEKGVGWHEIGEVKYIPWSEHKGPCELSYKFTCITFHECPLSDDNRKPWKVSQNWYRKIPSIAPGQSKDTINSCWWVWSTWVQSATGAGRRDWGSAWRGWEGSQRMSIVKGTLGDLLFFSAMFYEHPLTVFGIHHIPVDRPALKILLIHTSIPVLLNFILMMCLHSIMFK